MAKKNKSKEKISLAHDSINALLRNQPSIGETSGEEKWKTEIPNEKLINPDDFRSIEIASYAHKKSDQNKIPIDLVDFSSNNIAIRTSKDAIKKGEDYSFIVNMKSTKCNIDFDFEGEIMETHSIDSESDLVIISGEALNSSPFKEFRKSLDERQAEIIDFLRTIKGLDE